MKLFLKILIINITIIGILLVISEVYFFQKAKDEHKCIEEKYGNGKYTELKYNTHSPTFEELYEKVYKNHFMRKPSGLKYEKPSIILLGGSYVYGHGLNDTQTFSYKLSEETKRPVYNKGIPGAGAQHLYYQVERNDFAKETIYSPEYIIYLFIYEFDYDRLSSSINATDFNIQYKKNKSGELVKQKTLLPEFIRGLYTTRCIKREIFNNNIKKNVEENENTIFDYLFNTNRKIKEKYPKAQFIILNLELNNEETTIAHKKRKQNFINRLRENNLIVYDLNKITDINFANKHYMKSEKDDHPTEEYWTIAVPKIAKELNLY